MDAQYHEKVGILFDYGLTVLATVISTRGDDHAVINTGMKTMTQDSGMPLMLEPQGWEFTGLSEEHGKLKRAGAPTLHVGDIVRVVPNHGCTTINSYDRYHVLRRGRLEAIWPIAARGKVS